MRRISEFYEMKTIRDELWQLEQRSRELQGTRDEARAVWDDQSSRTINDRYLNPHKVFSETLLEALKDQQAALAEAHSHTVEIEKAHIQFNQLVIEVTEDIPKIRELLKDAERCCDVATRYAQGSESSMKEVHSLIAQVRHYGS
jgi:hypothetical protein